MPRGGGCCCLGHVKGAFWGKMLKDIIPVRAAAVSGLQAVSGQVQDLNLKES